MICPFCKNNFSPHRKNQISCSVRCNALLQVEKLRKFPQLLDGNWLFDEYWIKKKSMKQIANELGLSAESRVYVAMDKLGITRRTISNSNLGKEKSIQHKMNLSDAVKGRWRGKNNPNWKGGLGRQSLIPRFNYDYEVWRRQVKRKFDNTCGECGKKLGIICKCCGERSRTYAHHIKSVKDFPALATNIDNAILLCYQCHRDKHQN